MGTETENNANEGADGTATDDGMPPVPGTEGADTNTADNAESNAGAAAPVSNEMPTPNQGRGNRRGRQNKTAQAEKPAKTEAPVTTTPNAQVEAKEPELTPQEKARAKQQAQNLLESGVNDTPAARLTHEIDKALESMEPINNVDIDPDDLSDDVEILRNELINNIRIVRRERATVEELRNRVLRLEAQVEQTAKASAHLKRLKGAVAEGKCLPIKESRIGRLFVFALPLCANAARGSLGRVMTFMAEADEDLRPIEDTIKEAEMQSGISMIPDGGGQFCTLK